MAALQSMPPLTDLGNGTVCINEDTCYCADWYDSLGTPYERRLANALQWVGFGLSLATLFWYAWMAYKDTCGWEEVYVAIVEMVKCIIDAFWEYHPVCLAYLSTGNRVPWLRYAEWLLSCPVILIHLSNLTGLEGEYNDYTMKLLISDLGTIVMGASAAMATGWVKVGLFGIAMVYGIYTFYHAGKVFHETYYTVPEGRCRLVLKIMAGTYFLSWSMYPLLFLAGQEGFAKLSIYGSSAAHTILDLFSKNLWGLLGNYLRVMIFRHILTNGDFRKMLTMNTNQTALAGGSSRESQESLADQAAGGGDAADPYTLKAHYHNIRDIAIALRSSTAGSAGGRASLSTAPTGRISLSALQVNLATANRPSQSGHASGKPSRLSLSQGPTSTNNGTVNPNPNPNSATVAPETISASPTRNSLSPRPGTSNNGMAVPAAWPSSQVEAQVAAGSSRLLLHPPSASRPSLPSQPAESPPPASATVTVGAAGGGGGMTTKQSATDLPSLQDYVVPDEENQAR